MALLDANGRPIVREDKPVELVGIDHAKPGHDRTVRFEISKASYPLRKFSWTVTYGDERGWRIPLLPLVAVAGLYDKTADRPKAPTMREALAEGAEARVFPPKNPLKAARMR